MKFYCAKARHSIFLNDINFYYVENFIIFTSKIIDLICFGAFSTVAKILVSMTFVIFI